MRHITCAFLMTATAAFAADSSQSQRADSSKKADRNIVQTAQSNPDFRTLVTALQRADLADVLQGDGPFTVFAPTNEAFEALPEGTLQNLLKPENKEQLQRILKSHVVSGEVMAKQALNLSEAKTLSGATVPIESQRGRVQIGNATVTQADIQTRNGVIHVIDAVILPDQRRAAKPVLSQPERE